MSAGYYAGEEIAVDAAAVAAAVVAAMAVLRASDVAGRGCGPRGRGVLSLPSALSAC